MTLAEKIRQFAPETHSLVVAEELGCTASTVAIYRWVESNRELKRGHNRRAYHRNKVLGGPQDWNPTMDLELRTRLENGQSYATIAKAMGFGRNAIAGRVHRLKKSGAIS